MKQLLFTVLFATFAIITTQAQTQVIKTNPIGLAFGNFNATYERPINDKSSILVSASYLYRLFGIDVGAFGLGGAYRFYFTHAKKDVPTGLYINPQVSVGFGGADDANFNSFGVGAEVGYQWVWDSGVALDLGIGPNYTTVGGDVDDIDFDNTSGVLPSVTIAIGYAF